MISAYFPLSYLSDDELKELQYKASGISTRIVDRLVQDFFVKPMGDKIYVHDHFGTKQADKFLMDRLRGRLDTEHHVKFKCGWDERGMYIVRDEPTLQEEVTKELNRRKEKQ